jgi:signal transduction histidine kinase
MQRVDAGRFLVGAGLATGIVAGLPQVAAWVRGRAAFDRISIVWCAAYAAFIVAFLFAAESQRPSSRHPAVLALQTAAALTVLAIGSTGFEGALLCVAAGQAPLLLGERTGLAWVVTQIVGMFLVDLASPLHARPYMLSAAAYAGFQLFAFGALRLAVRERAARAELARTHAELLATQELFADSTRTAERLRISRELHDALGHHLTALSVQLELARNLADGRAKGPVGQAHAVTKELLSELRTVVSAMREDVPLDLAHALRTLVAGIQRPRVHLDVPDDLRVDGALAHVIFRCVQEALTNSLRHAHAENVFLAIEKRGDAVRVTARDDGRGATEVRPGHGLSGLRERIEGMGGEVEIEAKAGAGLTLRALLPLRAGAA